FAFGNLTTAFDALTPAQGNFELWTPPDDLASGAADGREPIGLDRAMTLLADRYPDRAVESISPPFDETSPYFAWMTRGYSPWTREGGAGNVYTAVDQYSGEVLYDGTPEAGNVFDQAWDDWSFPVHAGDVGGTATRIVWVVLGLAPFVLGVTGIT